MPIRHAARVVPAVLALCGLAATPPALAGKPKVEELAPFLPWNVDWTDKTCVLQRGFGTVEDPLVLRLERFGPQPGFQLVVTGKRLTPVSQGDTLYIRYGEGGPVHRINRVLIGDTKGGARSIFVPRTSIAGDLHDTRADPAITEEMERKVTRISLARVHGREIVLKTGPLDKAFAAWRKCTRQLVATWGLDPEQQERLQRAATPRNDPGIWLHGDDYPVGALAKGAQAIVNFRLIVDAAGVPTDCEIQRSYSGELFDKASCRALMARARFEPALDEAGKPIASYYTSVISWIMSP